MAGVAVQSASCDQYEGVTNTFLDEFVLSTANLQFGKISQNEFQQLHAEFGGPVRSGLRPRPRLQRQRFSAPRSPSLARARPRVASTLREPRVREYLTGLAYCSVQIDPQERGQAFIF